MRVSQASGIGMGGRWERSLRGSVRERMVEDVEAVPSKAAKPEEGLGQVRGQPTSTLSRRVRVV